MSNNGKFNTEFSFSAPMDSEIAFVSGMNANVNFDFSNVNLKGWNLQAIYEDILKREQADGLNAVVKEALTSGNTELAN